MTMIHRRSFLRAGLALPFLAPLCRAADKFPDSRPFQFGISDSLLGGQLTRAMASIQAQPMAEVFAQAGMPRPGFLFNTADGLLRFLQESKIHLAMMPGIEYGWLGQAKGELVPLAVIYASGIRLKACVLTGAEDKMESLADLRGGALAHPKRCLHHTLVFLNHELARLNKQPKGFFTKVMTPADADEAIETVLNRESSAVLVDGCAWDTFQERKPGRAKRLRVIAQSHPFPTSAVLYKPGSLSENELKQFQDVLLTAHQKTFSRQILNFWRISKFVPYSEEYEKVVQDILREIPRPILPMPLAA